MCCKCCTTTFVVNVCACILYICIFHVYHFNFILKIKKTSGGDELIIFCCCVSHAHMDLVTPPVSQLLSRHGVQDWAAVDCHAGGSVLWLCACVFDGHLALAS